MADFAGNRFLLFRVADLACAAEVRRVREILPSMPATRIPGAADAVRGLINVRGRLLTLVDGCRVLGRQGVDGHHSIVLLDAGGRSLGVTVDEVVDLVTVDPADLSLRDQLPGIETRYVRGVGRHRERAFVIIDAEALLADMMPE